MDPSTSLGGQPVALAALRRPSRRLGPVSLEGYAFLAPALVVLAVFLLGPAIWVFGLSLYRWDLIAQNPDFIGLGNYQVLAHDRTFNKALEQTLYYVLGTVPTGMAIALGIALLLNQNLRGRGFIRSAIFAPYVMPLVATVLIWAWMMNPDFGVFNAALKALHLPQQEWLRSSRTVMPSIILYGLWQHVGYNTVIFLAGLANISPDVQEAARVDGARAWTRFWYITWPLLSPTTYFVLLISLIGSFKVVIQVIVFVGSDGGPDNAATTIGLYLYRQAFVSFHAGYAAAISVVLFLIILLITGIQMGFFSRRVFYQ